MEINQKHAKVILESLKYSIYHIKEYHGKMRAQMGAQWSYDEEKAIEPIREAIAEIKQSLKNNTHESKN